jgi:hypothetical protein
MRAYRLTLAAGLVAVALSACATVEPSRIMAPLDPADFAWSTGTGPNAVSGTAILRTVGGEARTCAGSEVQLTPDAPYTRERTLLLYRATDRAFLERGNSIIIAGEGYAFRQFVRTTTCDALGAFEFKGLPDGVYYLTASVLWEVPAGTYVSYMAPQGGWMMQRVTVSGGQSVRVILSR